MPSQSPVPNLLWITTTRLSAVVGAILDQYGPTSVVEVDGKRYSGDAVSALKREWCSNAKIRGTGWFRVTRDETALFGFDCSYQDFWAKPSEQPFLDELRARQLLRFDDGSAARYRASLQPTLFARLARGLRSLLG